MNVELRLNGVRVAHGDLARRLGESVTAMTKRAVEQRLAALRCPEHGRAPRVISSGSADRLQVETCCAAAAELVRVNWGRLPR